MVLEVTIFNIREGVKAGFEAAFAEVTKNLIAAPGCHTVELRECIEDENRYVLLIEWDSVDTHLRFREELDASDKPALLGDYYGAPPVGFHYGAPAVSG